MSSVVAMAAGAKLQDLIEYVMRSPVMTIDVSASLRDASAVMSDRRIGTLAVMQGSDIVGIISERDIVSALAEGVDPDDALVGSFMSRDPRYLTAGEDVASAIEVMSAAGIRHLPVFDEGELIGMVSIRDLVSVRRGIPEHPRG